MMAQAIYGNILINIPNGHNIDSRMVVDQREDFRNNSNNFIANNIIDGTIRFMGQTDEQRHCIKGCNYLLMNKKESQRNNRIMNLEYAGGDVTIKNWKYKDGRLIIPKEYRSIVKM